MAIILSMKGFVVLSVLAIACFRDPDQMRAAAIELIEQGFDAKVLDEIDDENPAAGWIAIKPSSPPNSIAPASSTGRTTRSSRFAASSSKSKPSEQRNDEASATAGSRNRAGRDHAFLAPRFRDEV